MVTIEIDFTDSLESLFELLQLYFIKTVNIIDLIMNELILHKQNLYFSG
jgi:hypothetical protein